MCLPSSIFPDCAGAPSSAPTASLASTATEKANKGEGTPAASGAQGANHGALTSRQAGAFVPGGPIGSYGGAEGRREGRAERGQGTARAGGTPRERRGGAAAGRARGRSQSPRVSAPRGRAAARRARSGLTHLAAVPRDRRGAGGAGERRKSGGRACAVARGGAGTWQQAGRLRASREPGGRRAAGARTMGEKPGTR